MLGRHRSRRWGIPLAFTDTGILLVAAVTTLGAWIARPVPWVPVAVPLIVAVAALVRRRPYLALAALAVLAADRSAQSWSGAGPLASAAVATTVTLVDDPSPAGSGVRATARLGAHHVELVAFGGPARRLAMRAAGERVAVAGRLGPAPMAVRRRLAERHVAGRLTVSGVGGWSAGAPAARAANRVRRLLERGASTMSSGERALYAGLVIGDDRHEPPELVAAFRASGLSHLTAVSGENVAFALLAVRPILYRLGLRGRLVGTVVVVGWFALLTRFEPSVLRAAVMTALATGAWYLARPATPVRLLGLAVTVLVLADPLLVWSIGFWLSVGATLGITTLTRPIAHRLPGPRGLIGAVAVAAAAQAGVAPVQLLAFGVPSVATLPANVLAVPVAGLVMVWGLTGGLVAGLVPAPVRSVLQLPARGALRWLAAVAHVGAAVPASWWWWIPVGVLALVAGRCRAAGRVRGRVRGARRSPL